MAFMAYTSCSWTAFMAWTTCCVQIYGIHGIHVTFMDRIHGMQKGCVQIHGIHGNTSHFHGPRSWHACPFHDWTWLARLEAAPVSSTAGLSIVIVISCLIDCHVMSLSLHSRTDRLSCHVIVITQHLLSDRLSCQCSLASDLLEHSAEAEHCLGPALLGTRHGTWMTCWHVGMFYGDGRDFGSSASLINCITTCLGQTPIAGH